METLKNQAELLRKKIRKHLNNLCFYQECLDTVEESMHKLATKRATKKAAKKANKLASLEAQKVDKVHSPVTVVTVDLESFGECLITDGSTPAEKADSPQPTPDREHIRSQHPRDKGAPIFQAFDVTQQNNKVSMENKSSNREPETEPTVSIEMDLAQRQSQLSAIMSQ
jgi:hypothetical protein